MAQPADVAVCSGRVRAIANSVGAGRRGIDLYYKGLGFFDAEEIQDAGSSSCAILRSRRRTCGRRPFSGPASSSVGSAITALAPHLADAILTSTARAAQSSYRKRTPSSSRRCEHTARWLALVDQVCRPSCSTSCSASRRMPMDPRAPAAAAENLKKLRGLIRRIQNRGYRRWRVPTTGAAGDRR